MKRIFWSDCANAQGDMSFRNAHMPEGTFSHIVAHMKPYVRKRTLMSYVIRLYLTA